MKQSNIENAGQVLLWPFLQHYFAALDILRDGEFPDINASSKAAYLIEFLVHGTSEFQQHRWPLNQILCGLPSDCLLAEPVPVTQFESDLSDELLRAATERWAPMRNTSIAGLRESFLQRDGRLQRIDTGWLLTVDGGVYDMLLDQLPWSLSMIQLAWMTEALYVSGDATDKT